MKFLVPALAAGALLAGCGSSSKSASSGSTSNAVVKSVSSSKLGSQILVDAQGMTLYRLSGETSGKFICTSAACLHVWHPLTVKQGSAVSGGIGSLSTVKRPDGTEEVTYKGMPLYTFAQDSAPGDANGEGIKDVGTWDAIKTSAAKGSSSASAKSGGGGSGY